MPSIRAGVPPLVASLSVSLALSTLRSASGLALSSCPPSTLASPASDRPAVYSAAPAAPAYAPRNTQQNSHLRRGSGFPPSARVRTRASLA
eukprot:2340866-Pyramimonas_sp.AAC.1